MSGWQVVEDPARWETHVVPIDDLRPHMLASCWCTPKRDDEQPSVIIHNALDQRERYETQELKPQ